MFRHRARTQSLADAAPSAFSLRSTRDGDTHVIAPGGELDLESAKALDDELARVERTDAAQIVVDLSGLKLIDSVGIGVLIHAAARSRAHDRLRILRGADNIQRPFELSGLASRLPFVTPPPRR